MTPPALRQTPRRRGLTAAIVAFAALLCLMWQAAPAPAATVGTGACTQTVSSATGVSVTQVGSNCEVTFAYSGADTTWTIPTGLASASFTIKGASSQTYGTNGSVMTGTLAGLGSHATALIKIGGLGTSTFSRPYPNGGAAGNNGAEAGGGASEIYLGGSLSTDRVLVAGGGGGGGLGPRNGQDANGATPGTRGTVIGTCGSFYNENGYGPGAGGYGYGGTSQFRTSGGGGGGYAGGGGAGYDATAAPACATNQGGTGGRGSSYAGANVTLTSNVGSWSSSSVRGTNSTYAMYTNTVAGSLVLTFPAISMTVTTQPPSTATNGAVLSGPVAVTLDDASGTPPAGVSVTAAIATSPGSQFSGLPTLTGTTTATTNASGIATFSNLSITGKAGAYTLKFTATGYPDATANTVTLGASSTAVGTTSVITTAVSSLTLASPLPTTTVTVQARDSGGNNVTSGFAGVGLTTNRGSLSGVTDNGNGTYTATFTASTTAGTATISGMLNGTAIGTTATVTINPGPATGLAVGTQPAAGAAYSGQVLSTQPTVRVVDAFGNTVADAGNAITASVVTAAGTTGSLGGTATVNAASGLATFSGLSVTGTASSSYRLRFTATGLASVDSNAFSLATAPQTISFTYSGGSKVVGDPPFSIAGTTTAAALVLQWQGTPGVCSVAGNASLIAGASRASVTILGAGTCTVTASQPGTTDFSAATAVPQSFSVSRGTQPALSISSASSVPFGSTLALATTGGAGTGAVTYALTTPGVCTLSSGQLTFSAAGACAVQATKAQDANYLAAQSAITTITVTRAAQAIAFTSTPPTNPLPGATYAVVATASSGLPVGLTLVQGGGTACNISGGSSPATITFLATGTCEVIASNAGSGNYLAAAVEPTQVLEVGALNQAITFGQPAARAFGSAPFGLTASASSGLSPTFTSQSGGVCTVTPGGLVSLVAVGTCTITASQSGNAQYAAASPVPRSFPVEAVTATAPHIQSASAGDEQITVSFTQPSFDGGAAVTGWRLVATPTSGPAVTSDACTGVTAPLVCTISGLTNGTEYTVTVAGINTAGVGNASVASGGMTPATAAMAVEGAFAVPGDSTVTLHWRPIANGALGGGTFVRYDLYQRESGSAWPGSPTASEATQATDSRAFTGLSNGTNYDYKVVVITSANAAEMAGNTTMVSEYAATVPGAPTDLTLTPSSPTSMVISWAAPTSNGGAGVTGYAPTISPSASCGPVTVDNTTGAAWCEVTGLAYSTAYSVSVTAANRMGTGGPAVGSHTTAADPNPPPPGGGADGTGTGNPSGSGSSSTPANGGKSSGKGTRGRGRLLSVGRVQRSNQAAGVTLTTRVRVSGAGVITQVARQRAAGRVLCSSTRRAPRAGTFTVRCVMSRATRAQLSGRPIAVRVTTRFRSTGSRVTTRVQSVVLARTPDPRTPVTG